MSNDDAGRNEREARSVALERAYVHDVYDQIANHFSVNRCRIWPKVRQFLDELEPGSVVADVGSGNGKYLQISNHIVSIGIDRCANFVSNSRRRGNEMLLADNMSLPFREHSFDACISIAVVHHFATTERRVSALRELARILKIGGKLMITAWSMEQRHRKFESQDVLVPWQRPKTRSRPYGGKSPSIDHDPNSTTTDEEDALHSYNKSNDEISPSNRSSRKTLRPRAYWRSVRSVKGVPPSPAWVSDDENDEGETDGRTSFPCRKHWNAESEATSPKDSCYSFVRKALQKLTNVRRLSTKRSLTLQIGDNQRNKYIIDNEKNDDICDVPIELRHLEPDDHSLLYIPPSLPPISLKIKSECQSNNSWSPHYTLNLKCQSPSPTFSGDSHQIITPLYAEISDESIRSKSSSSCFSLSSRTNISSPLSTSNQSEISADSTKGVDLNSRSWDSGVDEESARTRRRRPILQKQKTSIQQTDLDIPITINISEAENINFCGDIKSKSDNSYCSKKDYLNVSKIGEIKQSSFNDELISIDRQIENEKIKQSIQKQSSLNEDLIYGTKLENIEENDGSLPTNSNFKSIKETINKFRAASLDNFEFESTESLKNGVMKLIRSWKGDFSFINTNKFRSSPKECNEDNCDNEGKSFIEGNPFTKLFFTKKFKVQNGDSEASSNGIDECNSNNKPNVIISKLSTEFKGSREESSDSSKESSIQSDTSIDSEESFVSVIYIPKPGQISDASGKERNRSVSSESSEGSDKPTSPKSPKSPKSPGGGAYLSGSKFLAPKVSKFDSSSIKSYSSVDSKFFGSFISSHGTSTTIMKIIAPSTIVNSQIEGNTVSSTLTQNCSQVTIESPRLSTSNLLKESEISNELPSIKSTHDVKDYVDTTVNECQAGNVFNKSNSDITTPKVEPSNGKEKLSLSNHNNNDNNSEIKNENTYTTTINKHKDDSEIDLILPVLEASKKLNELYADKLSKSDKSSKCSPRLLTFEVFNPETDDLDSDSSPSSSPHSASSIIERGWPTEKEIDELDREIKRKEEEEKQKMSRDYFSNNEMDESDDIPKMSLVEPVHRMDTIKEEAQSTENSRENSPKEKEFPKYNTRRNSSPLSQIKPLVQSFLNAKTSRSSSICSNTIDDSHKNKNGTSTDNKTTASLTYNSVRPPEFMDYTLKKLSPFRGDSKSSDKEVLYKLNMDNKGNTMAKQISKNPNNLFAILINDNSIINQSSELIKNCEGNFSSNISDSVINDENIPILQNVTNVLKKGADTDIKNYQNILKSTKPLFKGEANDSIHDKKISEENRKSQILSSEPKQKSSSSLSKFRIVCRHCKREEERRKTDNFISSDTNVSETDNKNKSASVRRSWLRHQGSLDSSQEKDKDSLSNRGELSRSSSLDLETTYKLRNSFTRSDSYSTSQDSLQSDTGGNPTLHRYYHVFKEGELDQLIEKYVQNLHIISSFYDHANWCVVAEKVQVWTI